MATRYNTFDLGFILPASQQTRVILAVSQQAATSDAVLILWVKTGYDTGASAATITFNGQVLSPIWPRPWTNHNYINMEADSYLVPRNRLAPGFGIALPDLGVNVLTVTAKAGTYDYLWVTN